MMAKPKDQKSMALADLNFNIATTVIRKFMVTYEDWGLIMNIFSGLMHVCSRRLRVPFACIP